MSPFPVFPFFRRISQPPGKDSQNGKQTYGRLPPFFFKINTKDTIFHVPKNSIGICLSLHNSLYFLSNRCIISPIKTLPQVLSSTSPCRVKLLISPRQHFFENLFSLRRKRKKTMICFIDERWLFIGRFKTNQEREKKKRWLYLYINLNNEIYYSMYFEDTG